MTDGEDDYSCVYLGVHALGHALACRSGIPILSTSVNQPWLHFRASLRPSQCDPSLLMSQQRPHSVFSDGCNVLATLRWTLQRVACVVSSLAL